jgi:pilus assembly protein CpaB
VKQLDRRGILIVGAAVLAALIAGMLVLSISGSAAQQVSQSTGPAVSPTQVPSKQVVVAVTDVSANTVITGTMITLASYPADFVPADAFTNTQELIGLAAKSKLFGGQVLVRRQFVASGGRTGTSVNIPKDKVLVAFPSTDMMNNTGMVYPGDHVDIMLSVPISGSARIDAGVQMGSQVPGFGPTLVAQTTLQNIEVYSNRALAPTDQEGDPEKAGTGANVITFIVDPQEALILKYMKDSGGVIDLVIRSLEADQMHPTDPVNIDYLVDLYKFIGLPESQP